jgi:hypothetical protein
MLRKVWKVSADSDLIALCIASTDIELPVWASACMTFCGVLHKCKKILNTLCSKLHF